MFSTLFFYSLSGINLFMLSSNSCFAVKSYELNSVPLGLQPTYLPVLPALSTCLSQSVLSAPLYELSHLRPHFTFYTHILSATQQLSVGLLAVQCSVCPQLPLQTVQLHVFLQLYHYHTVQINISTLFGEFKYLKPSKIQRH